MITIKYTQKPSRIKKRRNIKQFKKQIVAQVNSARLDLTDNWFNGWHHHLDWYGIGQESSTWRKFFVQQHFNLFNNYLKQIQESSFNCQCWMIIDLLDAGLDAVYIHSNNPHTGKYYTFPRKLKINKIDINELPLELWWHIEYELRIDQGYDIINKYIFYHYNEGNFNSIWVETVEQSNSKNSIKQI